MRKGILLFLLLFLLAVPVSASEITAPTVPESGETLMPETAESFGEGLWWIVRQAIGSLQPSVAHASGIALSIIAVVLMESLLKTVQGSESKTLELAGSVAIGMLLLAPSNTMVQLGSETIRELSEYGKLLLPVMTAAMAAQGGTTTSAALYAGTVAFDAVLNAAIARILVPMIYIFLCLAVAGSAIGEENLKKLKDFVKWLATWGLKNLLYIFTGYLGFTGVVSGPVDAAAAKATRMAINGVVPVVGGILADATDAVLVGAGVMKNAAGVYGLLAIIAVWIGPFLRIGIQYLVLKLTAAICGVFGSEHTTTLIGDFSSAMGLLLAITGAMCLLLLVSTVCFMRGVA